MGENTVEFTADTREVANPDAQVLATKVVTGPLAHEDLASALSARKKAMALLSREQQRDNYASPVVAFSDSGDVSFLGECTKSWNASVGAAASKLGVTPADFFQQFASRPEDDRFRPFLGLDRTTTTTIPILNPQFADKEVLSRLQEIPVIVSVPPAWQDSKLRLCTRIDEGRNDCTYFSAARGHTAGNVTISAFINQSRALNVVLVAESGDVTLRDFGNVVVSSPPDGASGTRPTLTLAFAGEATTRDLTAQGPAGTVELVASTSFAG